MPGSDDLTATRSQQGRCHQALPDARRSPPADDQPALEERWRQAADGRAGRPPASSQPSPSTSSPNATEGASNAISGRPGAAGQEPRLASTSRPCRCSQRPRSWHLPPATAGSTRAPTVSCLARPAPAKPSIRHRPRPRRERLSRALHPHHRSGAAPAGGKARARPGPARKARPLPLLILDDLAYVQKDQAETSVLFELISARYERRSLLITANQPFGEWNKVFPDETTAVAAVDRLVHHATILEMNVESYRRRTALDRRRGPLGGPPRSPPRRTPPRTDTHLGVDPAAPTLAPCGVGIPVGGPRFAQRLPAAILHSGAPIDHADAPRQSVCVAPRQSTRRGPLQSPTAPQSCACRWRRESHPD